MKALIVLALLAAPAMAQQRPDPVPMPPGSYDCPTGYQQSGGYCIPNSPSARAAIVRVGPGCPLGYQHSGHGYCIKTGK